MYQLIQINDTTFELIIEGEYYYPLCESIRKIIKLSYWNEETNKIQFNAESVIPFKQIRNHYVSIIHSLTKQIQILQQLGYGFYGCSIDNILFIDGQFLFCDPTYLLPMDNDHLLVIHPIDIPIFATLEVKKLTKLPSQIHFTCIYYSLATLLIFKLFNTYSTDENTLKPIYNTKIYWFIKRCLTQQQCLFI
jgi:hypothetical protein